MKHTVSNHRSGQVALLILLGATMVFVVAISALRTSTENTRLAELEESAKQAYAAAEAGIEAALENSENINFVIDGISVTTEIENEPTGDFTTPLIPKDGQYTFYFAPFNETQRQIEGDTYSGDVTITLSEPENVSCDDSDAFAVELSFLDFTVGAETVYRRLIDPCDLYEEASHTWDFGTPYTLSEQTPDDPIEAHVMVMRVVAPSPSFEGVKLTVENDSGTSQGKVITSTAITNTEVAKKIKLFKSYPQLPADFFVTSF